MAIGGIRLAHYLVFHSVLSATDGAFKAKRGALIVHYTPRSKDRGSISVVLSNCRWSGYKGALMTAAQIVIRNLVRLVDLLPFAYLVGALAATFSRRSQRMGDLAAGTVVVREAAVAAWETPDLTNRFNSLAAWGFTSKWLPLTLHRATTVGLIDRRTSMRFAC